MIHVIKNFKRSSKKSIDNFRELAVATVYEASGRLGQIDNHIKPIRSGRKICGPAFTVQCHPRDNLMLHKALAMTLPGDVIVATTGGHHEAGYWGALMTTSAIARQLGGLAIDGCIRDSEEIRASGFPVFCRGFSITGTAKNTLGLINHPTIFGGALVNPGDIILGDDDGMVIISQARCEEIYTKSLERVKNETEKTELFKKGVTGVELYNLDSKFKALGLKED